MRMEAWWIDRTVELSRPPSLGVDEVGLLMEGAAADTAMRRRYDLWYRLALELGRFVRGQSAGRAAERPAVIATRGRFMKLFSSS